MYTTLLTRKLSSVASEELLRRGSEIAIVDIKDYGDWPHLAPRQQKRISDIIGIKPNLSLFFTNDQVPPYIYDTVARESKYQNKTFIMIGLIFAFTIRSYV